MKESSIPAIVRQSPKCVAEDGWYCQGVLSHEVIVGKMIRTELLKEDLRRLDVTYLGGAIDQWWKDCQTSSASLPSLSSLKLLITSTMTAEHLQMIQNVGSARSKISAVLMTHAFSAPDKALAKLVHESMTEICGIADIKYPYEDHKEIFPKKEEKITSDWGKGLGVIRPHSDDLYEDQSINAMCLTVCKDTSSTPTWVWLLKDAVAPITDEDLGRLALADAIFLSGANVEGRVIEVRKPVLNFDASEGVGLRLDFRIDQTNGPRMRFDDPEVQAIFDKLRSRLKELKPQCTHPATGSVTIIANYKVLHGRAALRPIMLYDGESSRILFRSKGIKQVAL